jgi:hypothetical protein
MSCAYTFSGLKKDKCLKSGQSDTKNGPKWAYRSQTKEKRAPASSLSLGDRPPSAPEMVEAPQGEQLLISSIIICP